ncbi:aldolase [Zobellella denitrificans]|jgi:ribulose-5-phosphate 4-epimerase/fuculose-1-phosphate aldolase|uniref:3-oxo-tetronate 4-phosphate decarboxylase n=2 Tax=Zobellella TaxID=347533 RepID=A0A291HNS4_9GAMM|nr:MULTISPECIES: 3-oxo-tetronate 4-phosphate decarboxylase [Zobellella]ATG73772.1 aldolase [Zobellella denitrificans]PSJ47216.1 aldolase [Zobellella taiwanensis]
MNEHKQREEIVLLGKSMYDRGLTHGGTGNISVRLNDGWLLTPTGSSLGRLDPARLSKLDWQGRHIGGDLPSKEAMLHLAMYQERPVSGAVVHLHSTHSVAVSVLDQLDPEDVLPAITAYYAMRVGKLPLVPYYAPGDPALAEAVRRFSGRHHAMLLAHHGPVVAGSDLHAAVDATEELEATAQLFLLLFQHKFKTLTPEQVADLQRRFAKR